MATFELFRSSALRATLAFALATTATILSTFGFVYWRIATADEARVRAILVDEAAKGADYGENDLRKALELRLTRDLRRLDYVALFGGSGELRFGNVGRMPDIRIDGRSHLVMHTTASDGVEVAEPVVFVARARPDGGVLLLGRSLSDSYALRATALDALATAIAPTLLIALAIGTVLARRTTSRLARLHDTIGRIMRGGLELRLPVREPSDEIDRLARDVNLMLDEIVRLLAQLRSVGENIAHDLRTPLAVMRAKLERGVAASEESALRHAAGQALDELDKAIAAIAALLRVAEIENGPASRKFADIDLSSLCEEVFEFYEPLGRDKSLAMTLASERPLRIRGDADLLREALSNLIDNAIKFTPEGGAVQVDARMEAGRPLVSVSDSGPGVPPEERDRIFDRYFRGDRTRSSRGRGVGLSITAAIARAHKLDIRVVDNKPGARFEISAPPTDGR